MLDMYCNLVMPNFRIGKCLSLILRPISVLGTIRAKMMFTYMLRGSVILFGHFVIINMQ